MEEETKIEETREEKFTYTSEELEEAKEWDVTLEDGLEDEPTVEEVKEERDEDHELDLVLNEMVEDLEIPLAEENNTPSDFVGGYYGDILIDGNGPQAQLEENSILPVNSNTPTSKNTGIIDNAGSVHLNPTRL